MKMQAKRTLIEWLRDNYEITPRELTQVVHDIGVIIEEEYALTAGTTPDLDDEDDGDNSEDESDGDD